MEMVSITIDGEKVQVAKNSTVLEAAQTVGINIPHFVIIRNSETAASAESYLAVVFSVTTAHPAGERPVSEGMVVRTTTATVREARKTVVELLLANHPQDCLSCQRNLKCELQTMAADLGIRKGRFDGERKEYPLMPPIHP